MKIKLLLIVMSSCIPMFVYGQNTNPTFPASNPQGGKPAPIIPLTSSSNGSQNPQDTSSGKSGASSSTNGVQSSNGGGAPGQNAKPFQGGGNAGSFNAISDKRLKREINPLGENDAGIKLYSFKYLWSDQIFVGVMAQDLLANPKWKEAVRIDPNGYYSVNYSMLGFEMIALDNYRNPITLSLMH